MTNAETSIGTPVREVLAMQREAAAAAAFERIRSGQHWRDWTMIAQGLDVGRERAMREAHTNQPMGQNYNAAFGRWMDKNPWSRKLDNKTRNDLFWVADHLVEIEGWREGLATNQREALNHPTSVKRRYAAYQRDKEEKKDGQPQQLSSTAKLKEALVASEEKAAKWQKRAEESGSLFDLHKDTADDIGRTIVGNVSPSRAKKIADAINKELKQKSAHAG